MINSVYIAGLGCITAIGNNVAECFASLQKEEAGIATITHMDTVHQGVIPVAEVKLTNNELAELAGIPAKLSRTTLLSMIAAREALNDAAIPNLANLRAGFVSANTVGGMDKSEDFFVEFLADNNKGKLRDVYDHECGSMTEGCCCSIRFNRLHDDHQYRLLVICKCNFLWCPHDKKRLA